MDNYDVPRVLYQSSIRMLTLEEYVHEYTSLEEDMNGWRVVILPLEGLNSALELAEIVLPSTHIEHFVIAPML